METKDLCETKRTKEEGVYGKKSNQSSKQLQEKLDDMGFK